MMITIIIFFPLVLYDTFSIPYLLQLSATEQDGWTDATASTSKGCRQLTTTTGCCSATAQCTAIPDCRNNGSFFMTRTSTQADNVGFGMSLSNGALATPYC